MRQSSVVICGLARDLGALTKTTVAFVEATGRCFRDYRVVIVENDSSDCTAVELATWAVSNPKVTILSHTFGTLRYGSTRERERTEALASYRHRYWDFIAKTYPQCTHVIVVDTDTAGGWSLDGLATTFGRRDWGGVASNGLIHVPLPGRLNPQVYKQVHYDSWAFRLPPYPEALKNCPINGLNFQSGACLIPVLSAFGGLAVYTAAAFFSSGYEGYDCEHVPFHMRMADCGHTVFLNPNQLVYYNIPPRCALVLVGEALESTHALDSIRARCLT